MQQEQELSYVHFGSLRSEVISSTFYFFVSLYAVYQGSRGVSSKMSISGHPTVRYLEVSSFSYLRSFGFARISNGPTSALRLLFSAIVFFQGDFVFLVLWDNTGVAGIRGGHAGFAWVLLPAVLFVLCVDVVRSIGGGSMVLPGVCCGAGGCNGGAQCARKCA